MMLSKQEAEELVTLLKGGPLPPADLERALTLAQRLAVPEPEPKKEIPFSFPPFELDESRAARLIYPHVVSKTEMGDGGRVFVTASTNNNDTGVEVYIYWYIPDDGEAPYLVIEVDEDPPANDDVHLVVRRNDALIYEGKGEL